ncbi:MAG TPA: FtsW/RodA/SpoVE family cell cycle protein, partial [Opitutaceae bacterium]|nr:FtsW/RodA/SpoVE family cell cycle protein [Opitutaceae bacterium]
RRYTWAIAGAMLLLLLLVLVPHIGVSINGSRRWLGHGIFRLQVSEFAKLGMVFCLSHYVALNQTRIGDLKRGYLYPLAIVGAFAALVLAEPDFGTAALIVGVGMAMLFFAGAKWRHLVPTVLAVVAVFALAMMHNPNRMRRFTAFRHVEENRSRWTYQLYESEIAFAAGGPYGVGLGQGRQQYNYLPEAQNDYILGIIAEELGLPFTLGVLVVFGGIFAAGLMHLRRAPNLFHSLLVAGCLLVITLQAMINFASVTGVIPPKGMSLPFISAGISNLLLMGLLLGVLLNTQRTWGRARLPGNERMMREVLA